MSKSTILATGQITRSDSLTIELVKASDTPAMVLLHWPAAASVCEANPRALAAVTTAMVRVMAEAQAALSQIRQHHQL
jgi:hypothetical protein